MKKVLVYNFPTQGLSTSFKPLVTLKGYKKINKKNSSRFHELMNELKYECLKLEVNFKSEIWKFGDKKLDL